MPERSDHTAACPNIPTPLATTIAAVQKARVMIAQPWMKSSCPLTSFVVAQLLDKRRMSQLLVHGDSFVSHSRNGCADAFLRTDFDWIFFIDDDMICPIGPGPENAAWFNAYADLNLPEQFAGQHTIDRLLSHGKTLIGGLYWGRSAKGKAMFCEGANTPNVAEYVRRGPYNEIRETKWCATGALLVHRSVFLSIEKKYPRLGRGPDGKGGNYFSSSEHALFDCVEQTREFLSNGPMDGPKALKALAMLEHGAAEARHKSGLGQGEDVAFCVRAKEAGHPAYVDLGLWCGHAGLKIYHGKNTTA